MTEQQHTFMINHTGDNRHAKSLLGTEEKGWYLVVYMYIQYLSRRATFKGTYPFLKKQKIKKSTIFRQNGKNIQQALKNPFSLNHP